MTEGLKSLGNIKLILIGLLAGAALLVVGLLTDGRLAAPTVDPVPEPEEREAVKGLEEELSALLVRLLGRSDVQVMLYAADDGKKVYAVNGDAGRETYVILKEGSSERLEVVCVNSPEIVGAAVVCPSCGDRQKAEIIRLVSALFGVSSARVYVGG